MKELFKNKKFIIVSVILLLVLLIGGVYAVVVWTTTNYGVTLDTSCFDVDYELGQDINATLNPTDTLEVIDERENTITINSDMAVSNVSLAFDRACTRYTGIATLELNVLTINNAFTENGDSYESLQYFLIPYDSTEYPTVNISTLTGETFEYIKRGTITSTGVMDIYSTSLSPNQTKEYIIVFLINSNLIDTDVIGASFTSRIDSRVEQNLGTPITDFEYEINDREGTVKLTSYIGTSKTVVVPAFYEVEGVTYNTDLVSKTTSEYCTCCPKRCSTITILNSPFKNNTNIETVYLSDNLIEDTLEEAFYGCTSLKNVYGFPNSVTNMSNAFYGCTSLVNAPEIPNSVTDMYSTFYGCASLVNAPEIPNSVTDMYSTFYGCTSLVNAPEIPNSVTDMYSTFSGCTSLVNAPTIPSSVINMSFAFSGCTSLVTAPTIGNSVENMESAFEGCTSLVNAPTIPSSVTYMGYTFSGCTSLVNAPVIPNSVTNMSSTFQGCSNLTGTIRINSSSVENADSTFFDTVENITVEVPTGSTTYTTFDKTGYPSNVTITTFTP